MLLQGIHSLVEGAKGVRWLDAGDCGFSGLDGGAELGGFGREIRGEAGLAGLVSLPEGSLLCREVGF
jgi:hypothetical protein